MYALVIVEKPLDIALWPNEMSLLERNTATSIGTTKLPGCSWLIELEKGLSFFGTLLSALDKGKAKGLRYSVAFFKEKPEFISA